MFNLFMANSLALIHLLFILFVVFGGLLVLKHRWVMLFHVPAFLWGVIISFFGLRCPLTSLENEFRSLANAGGYEGGFIEHYVLGFVYPERVFGTLPSTIFIVIGILVLVINATVYWKIAKKGR